MPQFTLTLYSRMLYLILQSFLPIFAYADAPRLSKAMKIAANDLNLSHLWVVCPGQEAYALSDAISVLPLNHIVDNWPY